jgi:hypothetical protein
MKCYIYCNVRLAYSSILTVCDSTGRNKERAQSEKKVFVLQDYHSPIEMGGTKNVRRESLTYLMHDK